MTSSASTILYDLLLRVRPTQVGALLKSALRIERLHCPTETGHVFWIDPVSVFGRALMCGGVYEPGLTRVVLGLLSEGDTFLDVGANEGYFSILAASRVGESGAVHCVEPQARLLPVLRENVRRNGCARLFLHCVALSARDGYVELYLRPSTNTGASSFFRHWRIGSRRVRVPAVTLATLCRAHALTRIRLMKVDCEGAEQLVIAGGIGLLDRQAIDYLALEFHPAICGQDTCAAVHARLLSRGYACALVHGHRIYYRPCLEDELRALGDVTTPWP